MNKPMRFLFALLTPLTVGLAGAGVSDPSLFATATPLSAGPGSFLLLGAGLLAMYVMQSRTATRATAKYTS
jgi:hypothetical protein